MVVTGGPDGAIPQSPAVRRRNGFAEACSVRCGAGASPATPTACEPRSGGSAASSATPPTNPPTSSTSTASATACRTRATGRRRSPRSDKLDPGRDLSLPSKRTRRMAAPRSSKRWRSRDRDGRRHGLIAPDQRRWGGTHTMRLLAVPRTRTVSRRSSSPILWRYSGRVSRNCGPAPTRGVRW